MIAGISEFSVFFWKLTAMRAEADVMSSGRLFQSFGQLRQMNGLRQLQDATGWHQVGGKSSTVNDDETASQQRGEEGQTGIEVQCRAELNIQGQQVWNWCAQEHEASENWQERLWCDLSDVDRRSTELQRWEPTGGDSVGWSIGDAT